MSRSVFSAAGSVEPMLLKYEFVCASAFTRPAVVTRFAAVVILRENRGAADRHDAFAAERRADLVARGFLDNGHRHGGKKFTVRQLTQSLLCACDPDELLDVRVPWCDVLVPNRPVVPVSVLRVRFEIEITPPIDLAPPGDRASTDLSSAKPAERRAGRRRIRILVVVDEELVPHFVTGVALALDRMVAHDRLAIAVAAKVHLVRLDVFHEILRGIDRWSGFEHERIETAFSELFRGPTTADTRADDDRIIDDALHRGAPLRTIWGASPTNLPGMICVFSTCVCTRSLVK